MISKMVVSLRPGLGLFHDSGHQEESSDMVESLSVAIHTFEHY